MSTTCSAPGCADGLRSSALPTAFPTEPPSTPGDFEREWRRNCKSDEDKYKYLRLCMPEVLSNVFKVALIASSVAPSLIPSACVHVPISCLGHLSWRHHPEERPPSGPIGPPLFVRYPMGRVLIELPSIASQVEVRADILGGIIQALDACWLSFVAFAEDDADGSALAEAAFVTSTLDALTGM